MFDEQNKIEELKKTLYSRQNFKPDKPVHDLSKQNFEVRENWQTESIKPAKNGWPLSKILVWFSFFFFLVAVGIAGFIYYNGYNTISADNVDIAVTGPTVIDTGRDATFAVAIDNRNQVDLEDVFLVIDYPDGAQKNSNETENLVQDRIALGKLASGGHSDRTISAAFYGLEGVQKKIKLTLEYHVTGTDNLFSKYKDYLFTLGAGPVSVVIANAGEVNSGQDINFSVTVTSNSSSLLHGVTLNTQYPFGFTFKNAIPEPNSNNNNWQIGDLLPGEKRTFNIVGKLEGQENEERAFKFNVGTSNPADPKEIAVLFSANTETVKIQKPFVGLSMLLNGSDVNPYPMNAGNSVNVNVLYSNNMPTSISNAVITVKLDGAILDRNNIFANQGFFQSADNTITWDKRSLPALGFLSPGDRGSVQFSLKTLPYTSGASYAKSSQKIDLTTSVSGTSIGSGGNVPVSSGISRNITLISDVSLRAVSTYTSGPFTNTGPVPPKVEKETTYTITWSIANTFNNISNVNVSAVLPSYIKFLNKVDPQNEALTYNSSSGEVTWNVGNIKTNTGYGTTPRQVSFQVSVLPSLSQAGSVPVLMGDSVLTAKDTYTEKDLRAKAGAVSTDIVSDPKYQYGVGVVTK